MAPSKPSPALTPEQGWAGGTVGPPHATATDLDLAAGAWWALLVPPPHGAQGTGQAGRELPLARVWWPGVRCPRCGAGTGGLSSRTAAALFYFCFD